MLSFTDLRHMARARVDDAQALLAAGRYDGAIYIVGYAVECMLKARVATNLMGQRGFPESNKEFDDLKKLQSHNLESLLALSGRTSKVKSRYGAEWSFVHTRWKPEQRYERVGKATQKDAEDMLDSVSKLMKAL